MAEIIWTDPALTDLDGIAEYIALDKPEAAARLVQRVFKRVELLGSHPELGPRVSELSRSSPYRQVVESPCRVFYRFDRRARCVYILGVMRGEKLFQKRLLYGRDSSREGETEMR